MKKFLLLGIMLLTIAGSMNAQEAKTDASISVAWQATWDASSKTMGWKGAGGWYILNTGFPGGDITAYKKIYVKLADFSDNADNIRLIIKDNNDKSAVYKLKAGENNVDLSDHATKFPKCDFTNIADITFWGSEEAVSGKTINEEHPASVKIVEAYGIYEGLDNSTNYLKISTNSVKTDPWAWQIKYKLNTPLVSGKTYELSMLAKSTGKINPENGNIWFWPEDPGTTYTGYYIGTEWKICKCTFKAGDNHQYLVWNFGPFEGDIYFDNVTLKEQGTTTNLMEDDFENDELSANWCDGGWNKPSSYTIVSEKTDLDRPNMNVVVTDSKVSVWCKKPSAGSTQVEANAEGVYEVAAAKKVSNPWDTQVFIRSSQPLPAGALYSIKFKAKSDPAVSARAQIHGAPDGNNYRYDLTDKSFGTDWDTYTIEGKITDDRGGQSLAFNLSQDGEDVTYYFKDIEFTVTVDEKTATALNGKTTITIGEKGSRTYCCNYALDFSGVTGLKAYAISAFDGANAKVTMTEVTKAPANTGLYLVGDADDYEVPVADEAAAIGTNLLVGINSTESDYVEASGTGFVNLVLATTAAGRGFHPLSKAGKMGHNKAYLHVDAEEFAKLPDAGAPVRFVIDDEEPTGIAEVDATDANDGAWYTINGVKLAGEPTEKGIYIYNGKKVAIQ